MNLSWPARAWLYPSMDEPASQALAADLDIPVALARVFVQRGINNCLQAERFLTPSFAELLPAQDLLGMDRAVTILGQAIQAKAPITIYGDYDVDGMTASALLKRFFTMLGLEVTAYQPDRMGQGYGLHQEAVQKLHARAVARYGTAGLLVTVDCGISNQQEVRLAKELGFQVIITDHHQVGGSLPRADAIINPHQPGCRFADKNLAGVGVAFYLLMGLRGHLLQQGFWTEARMPNLKNFLDLVALGTVADLVPLIGVNRVLVRGGLEVLNQKAGNRELAPGLAALVAIACEPGQPLTAEDISFRLAPRLNAAGRVASPAMALELLLTDDQAQAQVLAQALDQTNQQRREVEANIYCQATELADTLVKQGASSLVLWAREWHPGVIGIVASRLAEQYWRPCVLFSEQNGLARGSARSLPGVNLYELLQSCDQDLIRGFGGHAGAAGLQVMSEHLEMFRHDFDLNVKKGVDPCLLQPRLEVDGEILLEELFAHSFLTNYSRMFPFGRNNPEPLFVIRQCRFVEARVVGADRSHLSFVLAQNRKRGKGIGFGLAGLAPLVQNQDMDVVVRIHLDSFQGKRKWGLILIDACPSSVTC